MARLTKKQQAQKRRDDWSRAVDEGRVIRIFDGAEFMSFPTIAARDAKIAELEAAEVPVQIVQPVQPLLTRLNITSDAASREAAKSRSASRRVAIMTKRPVTPQIGRA